MSEHGVWGEEIAHNFGLAKDTVYRWIETRGLPTHRMGRIWNFEVSEVDECVRCGEAVRDDNG